MKALTGLSQAQCDHLLPVFSDIYQTTQQQTYEQGVESGTRRRKPGGGSKGKLPTMAEKLQFVLSYYKTYPTFDVLGTQFEMARSKAHENLHKLSPILYDTLVHLELMPYRESLNLSQFVARKYWLRSCVYPRRFRAHLVQRGGPLQCRLFPMSTNFSLLQTPIN
jgi:hypothetical protein